MKNKTTDQDKGAVILKVDFKQHKSPSSDTIETQLTQGGFHDGEQNFLYIQQGHFACPSCDAWMIIDLTHYQNGNKITIRQGLDD